MGAKKGLGATKVHTNFEEIEKEAQLADSLRSQKATEVKPEEIESQVSFSFFFHNLISNLKKTRLLLTRNY